MKIAIVDDEPVWLDKIREYIEGYFALIGESDYEINVFSSGMDFIQCVNEIDLLFLDVELSDGENGFDIAEQLQLADSNCKICFLTSHIEYARLGYRVSAYRYIDKLHLDEIDEAIGNYLSSVKKAEYIECRDENDLIRAIDVGEVLYVETIQHKLCYHLAEDKSYFSDGNLKSLAEKYEKLDLIQIQRSYVVNMKYIRCHDSRNVTMIDGTKLPISRDRVQDFKLKYFNWRRKANM
jgi:DNA-binding LytR/AlgR family response regulator